MKQHIWIPLVCLALSAQAQVNDNHQAFVDSLYQYALNNNRSIEFLEHLCESIGPRLSGSDEAARAVTYTADLMRELEFDRVELQEVLVPHWERGSTEEAFIRSGDRSWQIPVSALGGSIATPPGGITDNVVEVQNFRDLKELGREELEGKIVFFNRPMNPVHVSTFSAYGGSVDQRWAGAMEAAKYGASGVLVRSLTLRLDDYPHTGSMAYADSLPKIPAAAISTNAAQLLDELLDKDPNTEASFTLSCATYPDTLSHNVIGELIGSVHPDRYIVVGGHLDSWDLGQGAHDDGAGSVQSIEALRILRAMGYRPRHTLRTVLYMNEENGLRGGKGYAEIARETNMNHVAAIESDRGGFSPRGFHFEATPEQVAFLKGLQPYFEKYGLYDFKEGGSGADIRQLKDGKVMLIGLVPDSQRYFDFHHAATDVFDAVNARELQLGAAAMAALIYLIDQTVE